MSAPAFDYDFEDDDLIEDPMPTDKDDPYPDEDEDELPNEDEDDDDE